VIVADDWLSKLADKYLGNPMAYLAIVYYTNEKNAEDASYAKITDPDLIEVGWKVYIPSAEEATAALKPEAPEGAQTLVVGLQSFPANPNPYRSISGLQFNIYYTVFDTLTFMTPSGELVPRLAKSWEQLDDTYWRITIHDGVTFHNGDPLTSEDVQFTFEHAFDPDNAYAILARSKPMTVTVVSDHVFDIETTGPDPLFLRRLVLLSIFPKKYFGEVGGRDAFEQAMVGTGPFKLEDYEPDVRMVLVKNEDYFGGPRQLDQITLLNMKEPAVRASALKTGEVDLIRDVPFDQIEELGATPGIKLANPPLSVSWLYDINTLTGHPALKDVRVRQALNYAIDKEAIVDGLLLGRGRVLDCQISTPDAFGYNPDLEPYPYDPDKARQLLSEAGYSPGDIELTLQYVSGYLPAGDQVGEAVAAYLEDVGITVNIEVLEYARYIRFFYGEVQGDLFNWPPRSVAGDAEFVLPFYMCDSRKPSFCDPHLDELFAASRVEMDSQRRLELLHEIQAYACEQAVQIFLVQPESIWAMKDDVQGFVASPHDFPIYDEIYRGSQ
jgi:peptide/nickel transport system substrate-binding protein